MSSDHFVDSGRGSVPEVDGALDFKPRASRLLARFLVVVHVVTALAVLICIPSRIAVAALLVIVALSFYLNYRHHILHRGARAARRIVCQGDGRWLLQDDRGRMQAATLLPSSYLHPRLVILNFKLDQRPRRRNLVLCSDSLDAQALRQLRSRLRVVTQAQTSTRYRQA